MARTVYVTTQLTGGGSALDGIDGNDMVKGDVAFYINRDTTTPGHEGNYSGVYMATTDAGSESSPNLITPDDNAGSWNWDLLQPLSVVKNATGKTMTLDNYGVSIIYSTGATVHRLLRPRKGARKTIVFSTTSVVKVRLSTAAEQYTVSLAGANKNVIAFTSRVVNFTSMMRPTIEMVGVSTARWRVLNLVPWSTNKLKFSSST